MVDRELENRIYVVRKINRDALAIMSESHGFEPPTNPEKTTKDQWKDLAKIFETRATRIIALGQKIKIDAKKLYPK